MITIWIWIVRYTEGCRRRETCDASCAGIGIYCTDLFVKLFDKTEELNVNIENVRNIIITSDVKQRLLLVLVVVRSAIENNSGDGWATGCSKTTASHFIKDLSGKRIFFTTNAYGQS